MERYNVNILSWNGYYDGSAPSLKMLSWCRENVGLPWLDWGYIADCNVDPQLGYSFWFKRHEDAVWFKLVWC